MSANDTYEAVTSTEGDYVVPGHNAQTSANDTYETVTSTEGDYVVVSDMVIIIITPNTTRGGSERDPF